ncbi:unnamed protein product [Rhodiola kirilowii]
MGGSFSQLCPCFDPSAANRPEGAKDNQKQLHQQPDVLFTSSEPLDETLGHSFCYVRSSARFLSPTPSDRFLSPSHSLRYSPPHHEGSVKSRTGQPETGFRSISGASVSANCFTPRTVLELDVDEDGAGVDSSSFCKSESVVSGMFKSSSSFSALPLQPNVSRTGEAVAGDGGFFMSGPIERGALSGPLEGNLSTAGSDQVPFSAPLGGMYAKTKRRKGISGFRKKFYKSIPERKQPWVVPVFNFVGRKEVPVMGHGMEADVRNHEESNVQWALGKAGEDRVHVVVSEEHGWLFVGIYDGFNGPDAPEFLMANFYRAMYNELQGLFWEVEEKQPTNVASVSVDEISAQPPMVQGAEKKVTFHTEQIDRRRRLWELLAEDHPDDGLDLSGSERFAFSVDDAISVNKVGSAANRRWLLLSKLRLKLLSNSKHKEGHGKKLLFPWKFGLETNKYEEDIGDKVGEERPPHSGKKRKVGPVDHELVLNAMSRALDMTEAAYLDMTDKYLDRNPELALMGSCLLVVLMRDEDVYVMNVGDSRAIVAQSEQEEVDPSTDLEGHAENGSSTEAIVEEPTKTLSEKVNEMIHRNSAQAVKLAALQLSTDHSTSIEEEVLRIKNEHPDDSQCIVNDRVKGRLKVTRAFGAGFLKQSKWNDPLLEIFRNDYIGTAPYLSCTPSLRHHKLCPRDQFLVLSSDGLYQYLTNQEVVSHVESFMEKSPEGDPAQHLIEELLSRAAKKAGMDLHELLDIPQGDRRKYHDDVTVMVVSLEGRIWKSSGKYF